MNKPPVPSNRVLIVMPYWEGDKEPAMKLARLISDLEPVKSVQADILFVARFDCTHSRTDIDYVARKFVVYTHQSKRRGQGWPNGCNSLFFGSLEWVYHKMAAGQVPHYKAVLNLAADCVPICNNWLTHFTTSFDSLNRPFVSGAYVDAAHSDGREHINGDCMLLSSDLKFLRWLALDVGDIQSAGWDWILAQDFKRWGWANLPFVKSGWNFTEQFTQEMWDTEKAAGTVVFHGVKNYSLQKLARKNLL